MVISKYNKNKVKDMIKFCEVKNIGMFSISRYVPIHPNEKMNSKSMLSPNELKELYKMVNKEAYRLNILKKSPLIMRTRPLWCLLPHKSGNFFGGGCSASTTLLVILPNADVLPCRRLPIKVGNLKKDRLFEIWDGSDVLWDLRNKSKFKKCGRCEYKDLCGGCRALAYSKYGDYMGKDPQCWK